MKSKGVITWVLFYLSRFFKYQYWEETSKIFHEKHLKNVLTV